MKYSCFGAGCRTVDKICLDFMSVAANAAAVRKSPAVAVQLQTATLSWEDARKSWEMFPIPMQKKSPGKWRKYWRNETQMLSRQLFVLYKALEDRDAKWQIHAWALVHFAFWLSHTRWCELGYFSLPGYPAACPLQYDKRNGATATREGKRIALAAAPPARANTDERERGEGRLIQHPIVH